MGANIYYLQLISTSVNIFLMKKDILTEILFLKKKRQKALEKKPGSKFVRINTSNTKSGYDFDYKIGNIEVFIDEFKNKK